MKSLVPIAFALGMNHLRCVAMAGLALAATVLASCGAPAPPPVAKAALALEPMFPPRLVAGCLLPNPAVYAAALPARRSIVLRVDVGADGVATGARVTESSGSAAIDAAYVSSALECRYLAATRGPNKVGASYLLEHGWLAGSGFAGPLRCFTPEYPRGAIRRIQTGSVRIRFSLASADGPANVRLVSEADPSLARAAVEGVTACLAHPEARQGLQTGTWYEVPFEFRLE